MPANNRPRLRNVNKVEEPYPLNQFPNNFGIKLGREIIYLLSTKSQPSLQGEEWEEIFARSIGAEWTPSNVGLDDVRLGSFAWGAKTVKASKPSQAKSVRLISGRNSVAFSFGESRVKDIDANPLGQKVLQIWNERVSSIRQKYSSLRTIVLMKSNDLSELAVFEMETILYDPELYVWKWNKHENLEGFDKATATHRFTWQPHGSQFTIKENVPTQILILKIKLPEKLDKDKYLSAIGFEESWVEVIKRI